MSARRWASVAATVVVLLALAACSPQPAAGPSPTKGANGMTPNEAKAQVMELYQATAALVSADGRAELTG